MKTKTLLLFLSFIFTLSCNQKKKKELNENELTIHKKENKFAKISILGTFHFGNTSDYSSIVIEDLDSENRQLELDNLVEKLAKFKPTKILVEREPSYTDTLTQRLTEYKNGNFKLPNNEIYQLGFRLAKKLELDTIYGIDHQMGLGDQDLVEFLQNNQLMEKFSEIVKTAQDWANQETKFLKSHTLGESLERLNTSKSDDFNRSMYIDKILNITKSGNSPASDYVSKWYKRNIYIKKNIDDLIEKNDRVLVIIGAGHSAILKDFYKGSEKFEYVEISNIDKKQIQSKK